MNFTENQTKAIFNEGHNVLVSASAGSGKTRVLVQRVIEKLKRGIRIDQLLIVTFTNAAAKEMRERIEAALHAEINQTTDVAQRRFYLQQLTLLPVADISTLDAFCQKIVKRYYYVINIDPVFRLLTDQTEGMLLRDAVWQDVREARYEDDPEQHFAALTMNFSNDRSDDGLTDLIQKLYFFANASPDPDGWLARIPEIYQMTGDQLHESPFYQQQLLPILVGVMQAVLDNLTAAYNVVEAAGMDKQIADLTTLIEQIDGVTTMAPNASYDQLRTAVAGVEWGRIPSVRKTSEDYQSYQAMKAYRDAAKASWTKELLDKYLTVDEDTMLMTIHDAEQLGTTLASVSQEFMTAYQNEKLRRHVLDFSDLEHFALQILSTQTDTVNVAQTLSDQYQEIMVDEYQDTNGLQEAILGKIAHDEPGNMFMVGDVKQSIYRFRQADPSLFMSKFDRYAKNDDGELIVLAENFRSAENVDDFTNLIFTQIMNRKLGELDYTGDALLKFGATYYPDEVRPKAELLIYEDPKKDASDDDEDLNTTFQVDGTAAGEIWVVANKIQELVQGGHQIFDRQAGEMRPVAYRDITLLTPTRKRNLQISELFQQAGIPVVIGDAESYFKTTEIQIMMAMLSIIDNPYQDIPLVTVLRSPIVGFNENQLAYLRINDKTGDYYQALRNFYDHYNPDMVGEFGHEVYDMLGPFLTQLNHFRDVAQQDSLVTLIWTIYQETGFLDYVGGMPAGPQRQANLHALYDRAKVYEASSFKGLFQFVCFIDRMQDRAQDLGEAPVQALENAVSVMTIHGSKGLEFPIVFLMDAAKRMNNRDAMGNALLDDKLGLGMAVTNQATRIQVDTLQKSVIANEISNKSVSEEMRKLYVALTRSEQQLFVVGSTTSAETLIHGWEQKAAVSPNLVLNDGDRNKGIIMDWIGLSLVRHPNFDRALLMDAPSFSGLSGNKTNFGISIYHADDLAETAVPLNDDEGDWLGKFQGEASTAVATEEVDVDRIEQVVHLQYQHMAATTTTAYQSVSEAKRLFEDPDFLELDHLSGDDAGKLAHRYVADDFTRPQFVQSVAKATPAEIGSATHLLLQQIDLSQPVTEARLKDTLAKMVTDGLVEQPTAAQVNVANVARFFTSPLGEMIQAAPARVSREVPFSLLLPASDLFNGFTDGDEQILIHGIMDGVLETSDHLILFDYKTDHVSRETDIEAIKNRYRGQINLYRAAVERLRHQAVTAQYLYLLDVGELVEVEPQQLN